MPILETGFRPVHTARGEGDASGAPEVSARACEGGAEFVAADRGPGIPAADRDRVVQRLVRLDASRGARQASRS
jgi:signal transduction histidine kinase